MRASALRRANIQRDADGVCSLRSFPRKSRQPARHSVVFLWIHPWTVPAFLTEPTRRNYVRSRPMMVPSTS